MNVHGTRWVSHALTGLLLTALAACGPTVIRPNPNPFSVPPDAAELLHGPQTIALHSAYKAETVEKIYTDLWAVDLRQYTGTAIAVLGKEMAKKGITPAAQAPKSITLRVYEVRATPTWRSFGVSLVLEAEYADGTKSTIQTGNNLSSQLHETLAVDNAIMVAVSRLLRDDQFLAYVNG